MDRRSANIRHDVGPTGKLRGSEPTTWHLCFDSLAEFIVLIQHFRTSHETVSYSAASDGLRIHNALVATYQSSLTMIIEYQHRTLYHCSSSRPGKNMCMELGWSTTKQLRGSVASISPQYVANCNE